MPRLLSVSYFQSQIAMLNSAVSFDLRRQPDSVHLIDVSCFLSLPIAYSTNYVQKCLFQSMKKAKSLIWGNFSFFKASIFILTLFVDSVASFLSGWKTTLKTLSPITIFSRVLYHLYEHWKNNLKSENNVHRLGSLVAKKVIATTNCLRLYKTDPMHVIVNERDKKRRKSEILQRNGGY